MEVKSTLWQNSHSRDPPWMRKARLWARPHSYLAPSLPGGLPSILLFLHRGESPPQALHLGSLTRELVSCGVLISMPRGHASHKWGPVGRRGYLCQGWGRTCPATAPVSAPQTVGTSYSFMFSTSDFQRRAARILKHAIPESIPESGALTSLPLDCHTQQ